MEVFTVESEKLKTEQKYYNRPKSMIGLGKRIKILEENINHENPLKLVEAYGVQLIPISNGYKAKIKGRSPSIFWNGMRLNPASLINNYSAHSVSEVDVYQNGAISFFSKEIKESFNNQFNTITLKGFDNTLPHEGIIMTRFKIRKDIISSFFKVLKGQFQIHFQGLSNDGNFYWLLYDIDSEENKGSQ